MVHVDGWYIIMCSPPFCGFSPLKEERVQEDPDATVSNGLMVRQLGETKLLLDDLLPRTQMCHILEGWDPIKWKVAF